MARRVCRFSSLIFTGVSCPAILERPGNARAVGRAVSRRRLRGPDSGCEAVPGLRSGCLVLRVDAVLTEQGAQPPLDLVGELLVSLGQNRLRQVPGGPLLVPRGLGGQ